MIEFLKPEIFSNLDFIFLVTFSIFTSAMTAVLGVGGGATLLSAMTLVMPISAIIPVHALVQLSSNGSRMWLMRKNILLRYIPYFILGSVIGAMIGGKVAININSYALEIFLGLFILYSCWSPVKLKLSNSKSVSLLGFITSFLTMFIGASGPLVIATMRNVIPDRKNLVATQAALMTCQHVIKAAVFGILGFQFFDWFGLAFFMMTGSFIGSYIGTHLLNKTTNNTYHKVLNIALSVIACRLIWQGCERLLF